MDADLDEELTVGVSVSTRSVEAGVPGVGFGAFPDQVSFAPGAMTAHLVITTVGDERWQSHVMLRMSVEMGMGYGFRRRIERGGAGARRRRAVDVSGLFEHPDDGFGGRGGRWWSS